MTLTGIFRIAPITVSALALMLSITSPLAPGSPGARAAAAPVGTTAAIGLVPLASSLNSALTVVHAGDGSGRLFIVLQGGQIMIFDGANANPLSLRLNVVPSPSGVRVNSTSVEFVSLASSPG